MLYLLRQEDTCAVLHWTWFGSAPAHAGQSYLLMSFQVVCIINSSSLDCNCLRAVRLALQSAA